MDFDDACVLAGVVMLIGAIAWLSIALAVGTTGLALTSYGVLRAARREKRKP